MSADKKKKILFVITKSNWGGAQRYLYDLATRLSAEKNDVSVALGIGGSARRSLDQGGELTKRLNDAGIKKIYELKSGRDIKIFEELRTFFSILWIIWRERPHVIHLNSSKVGGLGGLAAWLMRVPKIVFTAHGWAYDEDRPWWQKKFIIFFSRISAIFHHQIICVSEHSRASGKHLGAGYKKCITIHNAIKEIDFFGQDNARKFFIKNVNIKPTENTVWIGTVAEFTKNKGLPDLIDALTMLESKNWLCILIGSGEGKGQLKQQISANRLGDKVFTVGHQPDAARYLKAFDIFVMSSVKEGLPYVLLEAGSAGLAVLATDVGGIPEIVENEKTGLLSPPKYPRALADQLERLIKDEKLRDTLGENLRNKIAADFKFDIMLEMTKKFMKNNSIETKNISINSGEYPKNLKNIFDPPEALNILGDINKFLNSPKVAIVGTRRPTRYGLEMAEKLARELSNMGVVVVSGLALGIDSAAHRGALAGQTPTWAVLGSGLLNIQPTINRPLAEKIVAGNGAIISEFEDTYPANKWTFPQRNRIVAGLAQATIVVEAPEHSGALITADLATQYGRDVGAVPGETTSLNSRGTNNLIKNGAALIRNAEDVLELIGLEQKKLMLDNSDELENNILRLLENPLGADDISASLNQNILAVNQKLSILELKGAIKNQAGLFYKS